MIKKQFITLLLVLTIVSSSFLPIFTPRAQAIFGIGDITIDVKALLRSIVDGIAMSTAQKMVDQIVKSTVKWANTGFDGNPAYVTNYKQFFTNTADQIAGSFIEGSDLGFLCSPFQNSIRVSLARQYYDPPEEVFSCSMTEVVGNIEAFYDDFDQGGWDGWFSMTQNSSNNIYGAYLDARIELDSRIADAVGTSKAEYNTNQGFLSLKECDAYNPDQATIDDYEGQLYQVGSPASHIKDGTLPYDPTKPAGACIKDGAIKTAGNTIKAGLDRVLPSGLEKLISVEHVEALIGAFASGLLQRYVFGPKGLFGDSSGNTAASQNEAIDIDGDEIPDGIDYNDDGKLDICHHGLIDETKPASNENCFKSKDVQNSPFFVPLCQALQDATSGLDKYWEFINRNHFEVIHATTWLDRTIKASGVVDSLSNIIEQYEIMEYDKTLFTLGQYSGFLEGRITLLSDDKPKLAHNQNCQDECARQVYLKNTQGVIDYLNEFKAAMGQCQQPDGAAIGNIPQPVIEEDSEGGSGGATTPTTPAGNPGTPQG